LMSWVSNAVKGVRDPVAGFRSIHDRWALSIPTEMTSRG
jgi:hypothetical protein